MTAGERSDSRDGPRRAVLWDLDDTLIASQPLWDASFTRLCEAAGGRVTRKILGLLAGQLIAGTLELIAATGAASAPRARAILDAMNDEVIALVAADTRSSPAPANWWPPSPRAESLRPSSRPPSTRWSPPWPASSTAPSTP